MSVAVLFCKLVLAAVFLWAGLRKASASEIFAISIAQFTVLPSGFIRATSAALPVLEILAAILLLIPSTGRVGAGLIALLLLVFMIAIGWALSQGLAIDCGCFGASVPSRKRMWIAIVRDFVLFAMALCVVMQPSR